MNATDAFKSVFSWFAVSINNKEEDLDHDIDVTLPASGLRLMFTPPIPGEDSRVPKPNP